MIVNLTPLLTLRRRAGNAIRFARYLCRQRMLYAAWRYDWRSFHAWGRARREWPRERL